jgi:hypothetical protein
MTEKIKYRQMKGIQIFLFGLLITMTGFAQDKVKVQYLPSKLVPQTLMIIPFGDKYIYEDYTYFKKVYWLNSKDTLVLINDSILEGKLIRLNLNHYPIEYQFCSSKINKIRNSSLSHRIFSMANDSCRKYIGWDNNEFKNYQRNLAFEEGFDEKTCPDTFSKLAYQKLDSLNVKIQEIHKRKEQRTLWIRDNHSNVDQNFVSAFLVDFNYNNLDKESFIQLLIANPVIVIEEINKLEYPYQILLRVNEIRNISGISEAIIALEETKIKGKTKRYILNRLKRNKG